MNNNLYLCDRIKMSDQRRYSGAPTPTLTVLNDFFLILAALTDFSVGNCAQKHSLNPALKFSSNVAVSYKYVAKQNYLNSLNPAFHLTERG